MTSAVHYTPPTYWHPHIGFADKLRRVRLELGMNQAEFARSIGMKAAAYGHHETAKTRPRNAEGIALAIQGAHGVDAAWLLSGPEQSEPDSAPGRNRTGGTTYVPTAYEAVSLRLVA